jgi:hypothetical protein
MKSFNHAQLTINDKNVLQSYSEKKLEPVNEDNTKKTVKKAN